MTAIEKATVQIYERHADLYGRNRPPVHGDRARALGSAAVDGLPVVDLGCGPGGYGPDLSGVGGRAVVGVDGAWSMLERARAGECCVQADLEALPFRLRSLGAGWARNSYLHVPAGRLPMALAHLHHALAVGAPLSVSLLRGEDFTSDDDLPGRAFYCWEPGRLADVVSGAGFTDVRVEDAPRALWVTAQRARTLPDFVRPGLRLLVCGLNPSLVAADAGYGYAGPSNRFWKAAVAAGVVERARDPWSAVANDGVGMTDLVKRATPRSSELSPGEYRFGAERVRRVVEWLRPGAVCFVGLEGWRHAVDRAAVPGWQPHSLAGVPTYVMPSTSGLNARTSLGQLAGHLREALRGASRSEATGHGSTPPATGGHGATPEPTATTPG